MLTQVEFFCSKCKASLEHTIEVRPTGGINVHVDICGACENKAIDAADEAGYETGYNEGYSNCQEDARE